MINIRARKREIELLRKWGICVLLSCNSPKDLSEIEQGDIVDFVFKDSDGNKKSIRTIAFIVETVRVKDALAQSILASKRKQSYITYVVFMELSEHDRMFNSK